MPQPQVSSSARSSGSSPNRSRGRREIGAPGDCGFRIAGRVRGLGTGHLCRTPSQIRNPQDEDDLMKQDASLVITAALAMTLLFGSVALPATADAVGSAPIGEWQTWVLASGADVRPLPPPADHSSQTQGELAEIRQLQARRSDVTDTAVQYWNNGPATLRWTEL